MTSQHGPRGRNSDPFAGFRSGGATLHTDDRLDVDTYDDEVAMNPPAAGRVPPPAVDHASSRAPEAQPVVATRPGVGAARPRTRREAREAQARQAAPQQDHGPQVHGQQDHGPQDHGQQDYPQQDQWPPRAATEVQPPRQHLPASLIADPRRPQGHGTDIDWSAAHRGVSDRQAADQYAADHHAADQHPTDQYPADQYADNYSDDYADHYDAGYDDDAAGAERNAMGREGKRRGRGPRRVLVLIAVLAAVGLGSYFAWSGLQPAIQAVRNQFAPPPDFPGPGTGEAVVRVEQGETARAVALKLVAAGVVQSEGAFVDAAKANPEWTSVQVGDYRLMQQMPAAAAVAALLDETNQVVNRVTVNAGWRTDQVLQAVADATGVPYEQVVATALALPLPEGAALPPDIARAPSAIGDWEGWFLPYTYDIGSDPTPESVLTLMRDRTVTVLDGLGVPPDDRRRVLTEASLVQAEGRPEDYGMVARVIENRIAFGVPLANGAAGPKKLQFDSTTNYATGIFDAQTTQAQRDDPNPFNTYANEDLPPGPINSPSMEAIEATINPTPGPWLFFVSVNLCTGETRFAATLAEHEDNKTAYQEWLRANPKGPNGKYPCG